MPPKLTIGQKIVHQRYGAGTVVGIRKGGSDEEYDHYYVIDIPSRELKVHLPVDSPQDQPLRDLASMTGLDHALDMLSEEPLALPKDYRERQALVSELMTHGTVRSLARIIRDLGARQSCRNISTLESTMLANAKRQLAGELALAAGIMLPQAMSRIEKALVKSHANTPLPS